MTVKAAIYTRVSTEEQAGDGYGLDVQQEKCHAMATVKDWTVAAEFSDDGISGTKDETNRPGLEQMLEAACNGEVSAVIVASLDRLGRNTRLVLRLIDRLNECGVVIVSCKEALDTETPTGRFVLRMFASLAELERDNIVERTTDGRNARGLIDGERGGQLPLGYVRTINGVEVDQAGADLVRHIFTMRQGGASLRVIAEALNEDGVTTARGHIWHASSVKTVIDNEEKYRGGCRWKSDKRWPAIF